jgi:hypothetical protein
MRELEDERYVKELLADLYGVQLKKVPESDVPTFDYELLSDGQRVAAVEVKTLMLTPRTHDNGWERTDGGLMTRPDGDNAAKRVAALIHSAYKQLATATDPKVLVFVNDERLMNPLDLKEAVDGYLIYGDDVGRFKNLSGMRIAEGRIREEKTLIDLYVWINRYEGPSSCRLDGQPLATHEQLGPFFAFTSDAGYGLARRFFDVPETPKPEGDPDADVPTYAEMLRRAAGIRK